MVPEVLQVWRDLVTAHPFLGAAWQGKGEFARAMAEYNSVRPRLPDVDYRIARLLAATGKKNEARAMLSRLENPQPGAPPPDAFSVALVYAALGDRDRAFTWLDRACQRREVALLKVDPFLDPLRGDVRYAALLSRGGLAGR